MEEKYKVKLQFDTNLSVKNIEVEIPREEV